MGPGPNEWAQMGPGPGPNEWAQWARAQQGPNESPRMGPNGPGPRAQMNGPNRAQMNPLEGMTIKTEQLYRKSYRKSLRIYLFYRVLV